MFARVVDYTPKQEKKDEFFRMVRQDVLPILKKQPGFLELIPLIPENTNDRFFTVALWSDKFQAEKFIKSEAFAKVEQMLKPFLTTPNAYNIKTYTVETTVCHHLMEMLTAVA